MSLLQECYGVVLMEVALILVLLVQLQETFSRGRELEADISLHDTFHK